MIILPELSQAEMEILRQKPTTGRFTLTQGLILSLFDEKAGLHMALDALILKSREGVEADRVKKKLEKRISRLRNGDADAWRQLCNIAEHGQESWACQLVLKMSPLKEEVAA